MNYLFDNEGYLTPEKRPIPRVSPMKYVTPKRKFQVKCKSLKITPVKYQFIKKTTPQKPSCDSNYQSFQKYESVSKLLQTKLSEAKSIISHVKQNRRDLAISPQDSLGSKVYRSSQHLTSSFQAIENANSNLSQIARDVAGISKSLNSKNMTMSDLT